MPIRSSHSGVGTGAFWTCSLPRNPHPLTLASSPHPGELRHFCTYCPDGAVAHNETSDTISDDAIDILPGCTTGKRGPPPDERAEAKQRAVEAETRRLAAERSAKGIDESDDDEFEPEVDEFEITKRMWYGPFRSVSAEAPKRAFAGQVEYK
jgi:hypothetical protein